MLELIGAVLLMLLFLTYTKTCSLSGHNFQPLNKDQDVCTKCLMVVNKARK